MKSEVLIVFEDNLDAMKLAATWENVPASDDEVATYAEWAEISGVDIDDVSRLAPILFRNGILGPEGFVDPEAVEFIRDHLRIGGKVRR